MPQKSRTKNSQLSMRQQRDKQTKALTYLTFQTSLPNQENLWARTPVSVTNNRSPLLRKSPPELGENNAYVELYFLNCYSVTFLHDLQLWISSAFFSSSINNALKVLITCFIAETSQIAFQVPTRSSFSSSLSFVSSSSSSSSSFYTVSSLFISEFSIQTSLYFVT